MVFDKFITDNKDPKANRIKKKYGIDPNNPNDMEKSKKRMQMLRNEYNEYKRGMANSKSARAVPFEQFIDQDNDDYRVKSFKQRRPYFTNLKLREGLLIFIRLS